MNLDFQDFIDLLLRGKDNPANPKIKQTIVQNICTGLPFRESHSGWRREIFSFLHCSTLSSTTLSA
ncbi:hypothetical protein Cabys_2699 [Caldithrix abyssi DSM 13497]|uniref:Uncharacterized protein n=1 Tax=Caldithrix abyssi DSM 13497 TaxID=880073 RepID=A0A1J1C9W2_CALAY|nr:hypothetical protein Cabys_2699 [Caldithrix abyssi DSM 13497]